MQSITNGIFLKKCTHYKLIDTPTISVRPEVDCEVVDVVESGQIHPPSGDEHWKSLVWSLYGIPILNTPLKIYKIKWIVF